MEQLLNVSESEKLTRNSFDWDRIVEMTADAFRFTEDEVNAKTIDAIFGAYNSFLHHTPPYNPTGFRKSFCTHLVQKKVTLRAIQQLMGHEKCETTLTYYVQLSSDELKKTWMETNPYGSRS